MKKFIITCLYFALTLAVAAASYYLPSASSDYQDQQMSAEIEYSKIEPIALTYSSSLLDTMRLLSSGYYTVAYPLTGSSRTEEEIYEITLQAIKQLEAHKIVSPKFKKRIMGYHATLVLCISDSPEDTDVQYPTDSTAAAGSTSTLPGSSSEGRTVDYDGQSSRDITSAIMWHCYLNIENEINALFKIDDKSGKVAGFCIWSYPNILDTDDRTVDELTDAFCAFAQDYYELPAKAISHKVEDVQAAEYAQTKYTPSLLRCFIRLTEESGDEIRMPLLIYPDNWALN